LEQEEVYWRQRSKISWLKEEDRNTKFFHRKATWRAKKNSIEKLQKSDGSNTDDKAQMKEMTTKFFEELYKEDQNVNPDIILEDVEPQIS
jgi:predicted DsbA family dithiol-disulfide isomerase